MKKSKLFIVCFGLFFCSHLLIGQKSNDSIPDSNKTSTIVTEGLLQVPVLDVSSFKTLETELVEVRLTGIRNTVHTETCKIMDSGYFKIGLTEKSDCQNQYYEVISDTRDFSDLQGQHDAWQRWTKKKIAKNTYPENKRSPNNYNYSITFKVPKASIENDKVQLNLNFFIQGCHAQSGVFRDVQTYCSVVYTTSFTDSGLKYDTFGDFNLLKGKSLKDGPIEILAKSSDMSHGYGHEMLFYFTISILRS